VPKLDQKAAVEINIFFAFMCFIMQASDAELSECC